MTTDTEQTIEQPKVEEKKAALTSLADIKKLCESRQRVEFEFNNSPCALEVRKLTPAEDARIAAIIDSVIPAVIRGKTPEDDRLDTQNQDYIARKRDSALRARAQALYWAVPAFSTERPGMTDLNEITTYIQSQLTEAVLTLLWNATQQHGVDLAALVNAF